MLQGNPDFQKGNPVSSEIGRAEGKDKKGDKRFRDGDLHSGEGVMKEEKCPHTRKPLHRQGQQEHWDLRGECSDKHSKRCSEGNIEKIYHRDPA